MTFGCGSDNLNDDFNAIQLPPTASVTTSSSATSTSTSGSGSGGTTTTVTVTSNSSATTTVTAQPLLRLARSVVGVLPTDATGVPLFPGATVDAAPNTSHAGTTLTFSLPTTGSDGFTLVGPASPVATVSGSGTRSLVVTLTSAATAQTVQDFVRNVRVTSAGSSYGQQTTVTVTTAGAGQPTVVDSGTSVRVRSAGALSLTIDPASNTDATAGRYQTLSEAIAAVAALNGTGQGSLITLPAGTYALPAAGLPIGFDSANPNTNPDPDLEGLTLLGPNAGLSVGSVAATRGSEATLTTGGLIINAPHVTLDGLKLTGASPATSNLPTALFVERRGADFSVKNCVLDGGQTANSVGLLLASQSTAGTTVNNGGLRVASSEITGYSIGLFIVGQGNSTSTVRDHDVVQGNYIHNNSAAGVVPAAIAFFEVSNTTLQDNLFTSNTQFHVLIQNAQPSSGNVWSGNSFDNTAAVRRLNNGAPLALVVNAAQNWWNSAAGPNSGADSTTTTDSPGAAASDFTTTPFLTAPPFPAR